MNTFRRIESLYRENGYKTHYAEKKHNRILLLYPNTKKSKIYGVHMDSDYGLVNVGCMELFRGESSLLFRDCCYDDYNFIVSKIKKVDEDTTIELNIPYAEPCLRPHLLFENQEDVANSFLKNKRCGYPLQRRTDKPCDRRKFGAGNGDARDCNFRKQSGIIPERTGAKWQV